jgi:anti-anti-sigma factor
MGRGEIVMLQIQINQSGTLALLTLQGQIVNGQTELLRQAVNSLSGVNAVSIDLGRVTTIDARGLGALLELREQFAAGGVRFELTNVSKQIGRVLAVTRLDTVFQIATRVEFLPAVARGGHASSPRLASCA